MTDRKYTLGSLFDGSGGFPLGGLLTGIEPLWASEVEPFPIRVTTKRLPQVQHFGDINKINGAAVLPVDIITGGFCCQDLSVAGKRVGLHGERSGLFFQIIRIVKEMRAATENAYPSFVVLENVPGMYSSAGGADFLEVLNELIKIKQDGLVPDETLSIPMPESGRWSTSGEIVGDSFSLGWRTFDAQFWGVAQRRRRCYIVLDLAGERAGKILFDETRLRGHPPQGCGAGQETAGNPAAGAGGSVPVLMDQGGSCMDISENVTGTLRAQEHGHAPCVVQAAGFCTEHSAKARGVGFEEEKSPTLRSSVVPATVLSFEPGAVSRVGGHTGDDVSGTLRANAGDNQPAVVYDARGNGDGVIANTITGDHENRVTDYTALAVEPVLMRQREGCLGGGKGPLLQWDKSGTLACSNDQTLFAPKVYGISSYESNAMKSPSPTAGIYEADTARTLDANGGNPGCNQGGIAVVFDGKQVTSKENRSNPKPGDPCHTLASGSADSAVVAIEGNGSRPSHKGSGVSEDGVSFTLNATEVHGLAYGIDRAAFNMGGNAQYSPQFDIEKSATVVARGPNAVAHPSDTTYSMTTGSYTQVCEEQSPTLQARDFKDPPVVNRSQYIVRRLTPTECALLQGFPPDWCAGLETPEPTEEDIVFWTEVFETHRRIAGKSSKPKSRNQIIKWLQNPHSDAKEYSMWGNGVSLPVVVFVLSGIVYYAS